MPHSEILFRWIYHGTPLSFVANYVRTGRLPEEKCNTGLYGGAYYFSDLAMGVPFHAYSGTENGQTVKYVFAVPIPSGRLANPGGDDRLANVPVAQAGRGSNWWMYPRPPMGTVKMSWYNRFAPVENPTDSERMMEVQERYVMLGPDVVPKIGAVLEFRQRGVGLPPFEDK